MINLPKNIKIAAFIFEIVEMSREQSESEKIFGKFSCIEHKIFISTGLNNRKLLATGWAQVYQDNPDVLKFIKECTK